MWVAPSSAGAATASRSSAPRPSAVVPNDFVGSGAGGGAAATMRKRVSSVDAGATSVATPAALAALAALAASDDDRE